jgi:iron complex outermembrane receptor protein|tara:strand:- start:2153 stop:4735 length:2583 start_codon:yes stop_codon:yes gene_type:complete
MFGKIREKLTFYLSTFILLNASAFSGYVLSQDAVEEIVVTARKKAESLQDVPLSVSALRESSLEELGVNVFEDYLLQLPSVTAGGAGPGTSTIYIRGLASTTPNLTTAGVGGLAPNVSFYLDEQPLAQPGRNLDVYAADISRIEVLKGPQGTLFGASSQAGVVRMITNKPVIGESDLNLELETRRMGEGDPGAKVELVSNIPLGESTAMRIVAYRDRKGGYIDQVAGSVDVSHSARFRREGTIRDNGLPVSSARKGFQAGVDLSGVTMPSANAIVKENVNEVSYEGYRASIAHEIDDNWEALVTFSGQTLESDGVFFTDPALDDLEIQRYHNDSLEDEFDNASVTIEGSIGDLEILYTGAYTDRKSDQIIDYTDYLFVGQYLPYYICDYYVTYTTYAPGNVPTGNCGAPDMFVDSLTDTKVKTHELRINAPVSDNMSLTAGAFFSDLELMEHNMFTYPGSPVSDIGFKTNYALTDISVTGIPDHGKSKMYAGAGWHSGRGPYELPVVFVNDVRRTDKQQGIFGELSVDINDDIELTLGARWYDIEVDLEGSANASFGNGFGGPDEQRFGTNLSVQYDEPGAVSGNALLDALNYPDKAETDGVIGKATLSWNRTQDTMYYVTWSEGFRPGLLNRPAGQSTPDGSYTVRPVTDSDEVTNYEFGWKSVLNDGRLRFNGSLFFVDITGLQTTIFDPSIANLFFSDNAADAEISGLEGDFLYYPNIDGLMISGAFSILDTEIKESLTTSDVVAGQELAFAPGVQANLVARYEWGLAAGNTGHAQAQVNWSDESFSDIIEPNKAKQDSYSFLNLRAGISNEEWMTELYVDNVTDERAEISNNFVFDRQRVAVIRPMNYGFRFKRKF